MRVAMSDKVSPTCTVYSVCNGIGAVSTVDGGVARLRLITVWGATEAVAGLFATIAVNGRAGSSMIV